MNKKLLYLFFLFTFWFSAFPASAAFSDQAVVHAILFYSPSCGHCHLVINDVLPPLVEKYGDQLYLVGADVSQPGGQAIFLAALQYFKLDSGGVPFLVVGDTYLIGSVDIPEKFPGLIEQYLAQGGVDWPAIPGLAEAMAASQTAEASASEEATPTVAATVAAAAPPSAPIPTPTLGLLLTGNQTSGPAANFARDPAGNTLSVIVLALMLLSVGGATFPLQPKLGKGAALMNTLRSWGWMIPVLCLIGLGVAGYLAYVETAQVEAVCGPVGDCNTVQQSQYARLFGILPIGILGMIGYIMIFLAWILGRSDNQRMADYALLALFGLTTFGLLFSIYLTFLEPFVIGATCAWCLTSAVIMMVLFWLSFALASPVLVSLLHREKQAALTITDS